MQMNEPAEHIRKQVYHLNAQDLIDHPIWEFCSDEEGIEEQDEATVRPSEDQEVPGYSPGAYVVAADVVFADGTTAVGYVYSGRSDDFGCVQPNVIVGSSQINFWLGSLRYRGDLDAELTNYYQSLGKERDLIFPIIFTTRKKVNGVALQVAVAAFLGLDDNNRVVNRS
jgi:hypothetical protein